MFQTSRKTAWQCYLEEEKRAARRLRLDSGNALIGSIARITGLIVITGGCLAGWFGTYALGKFGRLIIEPTVTMTEAQRSVNSETSFRSPETERELEAPDTEVVRIDSNVRR